MPNNSKILFIALCLFSISNKLLAIPNLSLIQIDSLIQEKNINNDMAQLELLVLYNDALTKKHSDSIKIFKKLAILNANLNQPKDAFLFTEKYINNTLDFSILNNGAYNNINKTEEYKSLNDKYLIHITPLTFLYLYASLIGFFFALVINFTKQANKYAKVFIGAFVGAHSLFILEFVLYMSNIQYELPYTYRISSIIALLYGPLLYFYFKSITQDFKFKNVYLLHFLPTLILLAFLSPIYLLSPSEKIKMMLEINTDYKNYDLVIFISKITSLIIYAYFIGKLFLVKEKNNTSSNNITLWKKTIYRIHISYVISYLIYGLFAYGALGFISSLVYHIQIGIMSIMVIYIAYLAYVQPQMLKSETIPFKNKLFLEKYKKSGLTEALSKELKENLITLLVEEKIYKENNINLEILSKKLNTTRHNTSQIINEHFNMNFFELINKFRIKEAAHLLKEDVCGNLNIIDVAYEVGYNNKVTFNKAFKKEISLTPSEYIESHNQSITYE
ncbi:hypothetical protein A8C32_15250 [Flavivirga aquatica]|uniref:HTH araC/xylS-type domain-containing protein n=1 Tax=Flavivirga aquatica TaxID=1849968 RepID=A0A1E5T953_9FLAO|nr:helix-turn-helix domain-containing protein [Flavivirga aquatica]OEK07837.1 hypothetical protein A8C32_15250 [Flavivirga aquatica]